MAETLTTLKARRSCRAYKPDRIEKEKLDAVIEAGTYAATGMGKQSPIIIVVEDPEVHEKLRMTIGDTLIGIGDNIVEHRYLIKSLPLKSRHRFNLLLGTKGSTT